MDQIALNALLAEAGIPATGEHVVAYGVKDVEVFEKYVTFTLNTGQRRVRIESLDNPKAIVTSVKKALGQFQEEDEAVIKMAHHNLGLEDEDAPAEKPKKTRKRKTGEGE